ncbi:MAG: peptidoglycan DD-metalloendopeptidase family protein [Nitriliruptoraceae bacterium]
MRVQQGRGARVVAAVCALSLLPVAASAQTQGRVDGLAGVAAERDRVESEVGELRSRERDARQRLAAVESELAAAEEELETLRAELRAAEQARVAAEAAAVSAEAGLVRVTRELERTDAELGAAIGKLEVRVIAAYKYGQVSLAEVLAGVRDFSDLVSSSTMVSHVLDSDRVMVAEVERLVHSVADQQAEARRLQLDADRQAAAAATAAAVIEAATSAQTAVLSTIEERYEEREQLFVELRDDRASAEGHLAGLEAESARIEAQLAAIAREQAAEEARRQREADQAAAAAEAERQRAAAEAERQRAAEEAARRAAEEGAPSDDGAGESAQDPKQEDGGGEDGGEDAGADGGADGGGGGGATPSPSAPPEGDDGGSRSAPAPPPAAAAWVRPAAGPLTSPFGPRWGRNHNGIDIGAGVGSTVVAARGGTVVGVINGCHPTSSWGCGGGFGNYVTVAHTGGIATIYAHLSSVSVSVGQQLGAGQRIGGIGNSGNSYGPHLHFEVREAGVPRNPCNYVAC